MAILKGGEKIVFVGEKRENTSLLPDNRPKRSEYVARFEQMLVALYPEKNFTILDHTRNDNETSRTLGDKVDNDVISARPDVVVINIGVGDAYTCRASCEKEDLNPAEYKRRLIKIMNYIKSKLPSVKIVLLEPSLYMLDSSPVRQGPVVSLLEEYASSCMEVAKETSSIFIPVYRNIKTVMRYYDDSIFGEWWLSPNLKGHILLAQSLVRALCEIPSYFEDAFPLEKENDSLDTCPFPLENGKTFVFIGDSITDAGRKSPLHSPYGVGYVRSFIELLFASNPALNLNFINRGIGGDTIVDLLHRWERDALQYKPDYLSVKIGINDVNRYLSNNNSDLLSVEEYEKNFRKILSQTKEKLPNCKLLIISPFYLSESEYEEAYPSKVVKEVKKYIEVARKISEEFSAAFLNTNEMFLEHLKYRHYFTFGNECVHPNETGVAVLANGVYKTIKENW